MSLCPFIGDVSLARLVEGHLPDFSAVQVLFSPFFLCLVGVEGLFSTDGRLACFHLYAVLSNSAEKMGV